MQLLAPPSDPFFAVMATRADDLDGGDSDTDISLDADSNSDTDISTGD